MTLILLMALVSGAVLVELHEQMAQRLENTTHSLAQSVTQTFDGLLDTVDVALLSLADGLDQDDDLQLRSAAVTQALRRQQSRIPGIAGFRITDDQGRIINSSTPTSVFVRLADRDFFVRLRADPSAGLVVGGPVIGRVTGKWVWTFARRFNHPDGTFGGAVYAAINVKEVEKMLGKIRMEAGGSLALRDADLRLIARHTFGSRNPTPIGTKKVSNTMLTALKANSAEGGYISDANSLDPERRYYFYLRSQRYGYLANVGLSEKSAFATWRRQAWLVAILIISAGAVLMVLAELLIRALVRQGQFIASLEAGRIALDQRNRALVAAEADMWRAANFDELTGLPNRRLFSDRLEQKIRDVKRNRSSLAVLFIDIDRFKEVNDTLGHDVGDQLLIEAANRITASVRASDTVARLGGDEFTVILFGVVETGDIGQIAQKVIDALSVPYTLQGAAVYVSASIGIAKLPDDAATLVELLRNADQAMYVAKSAGRHCFRFFSGTMQEQALARMRMASDLRVAVEARQLQVHYQPIVDLRTGRVMKAEALVRWHCPGRGMVSPDAFIPVAEDTGLIHPLGDWVFEEVVGQIKRWRALYGCDFQISVNKSPIQFAADPASRARQGRQGCNWLDILHAEGLPGRCVVVEITEGALMQSDGNVMAVLQAFQEEGVQVAIDDFGTGYSALSYLKKFDVDYLKIDQLFIRNLSAGSTDLMLCCAMIEMAHKLGITVVAEGVETRDQLDLLVEIGCDFVQGYWLGRPMPPTAFEDFMREQGRA
ncbi:bifunctional diguanylate cyclase/phosphodiesterase [Bordetella sp. FB-8]|uniref:putative bifunctional diguanylate cyclase/phosphodiesterase n=1 Tax=Bordetella sp. FB-8 TaxID=1159870 RepID=UPI0018CBE755|nr:EAL domain-containing protein [Bordetella sp. FB-8]